MPITESELKALLTSIAPEISAFVRDEIAQALAPVESRLKAAESRPALEHVGAWKAETIYRPMQMVQLHSSCWLCLRETSAQPGTPNTGDSWRLVARGSR